MNFVQAEIAGRAALVACDQEASYEKLPSGETRKLSPAEEAETYMFPPLRDVTSPKTGV